MTGKGVVTNTKNPVKRLSHRHKRVLDFMIRNPEMKLGDVADALNYTQPWISTIVNSDLFQAEYDKRRSVFETADNRALQNKLNKIAHKGLDQLLDHIEYDPEEFDCDELDGPSFQEIKQVTELALKASGYLSGAKQPTINIQNNQTNVTNTQVAQSTLERARERIINGNSNSQTPKAIQSSSES
jgi:hypothetical protein